MACPTRTVVNQSVLCHLCLNLTNYLLQGELEHWSPKASYCRTDHKLFVRQLTWIKHRQACICHVGDSIVHQPHIEITELARSLDAHHHIGLTQKCPIHIGSYLHVHEGDPAIKNFVSKLKLHLLCQIMMSRNVAESDQDTNSIILKDNQMYCHNTTRFNYTIYDVHRAQDIINCMGYDINPQNSHCNVMVLGGKNDIMGPRGHKFIYAKVLGVYHTNVIFIGSGMVNYTPIQMEFLWVRWYPVSAWDTSTMDCVRFPPMADEHSFDFLDPTDVLRGCHIIPSFAGKRDGLMDQVSQHVQEIRMIGMHITLIGELCYHFMHDLYVVFFHTFRFVDHNMLMWFHFGLGVGHTYSHYHTSQAESQDEYLAGFAHNAQDIGDEEEVESHDEEDEDEEEDCERENGPEQQFGSSSESLLSELRDMYDSDLELDYEN
ncbi:uncharacterized protein EDB91DRAFT_1054736 [Suillus paluster]|uniref:uncharacterized protein n=1 Tax=Suillus paluster TaxID=48578 RepID=UPI001B885293|nr:uncharacterized protein EDB91DRAFT_1054736 [Suillus paluster]KAG1738145.1 hypothetical protein EDB91DRAFT_1054736 [Suillus paluster]